MSGALTSKVLSVASFEERLRDAPGMREGLVLANGIFDLLHVGHIRYLAGARDAGSTLLVAVNSDESARRSKGEGRPLLPLEERMEIVSAIACVDWVTWFEEDSVDEVLRRLRPAIHAKGTDYTEESVPERETARALGIRTLIVGDAKQHATSEMIRKIRLAVPVRPRDATRG